MFRKTNQQISNNGSTESSQKDQSIKLWQPLTEADQEITKGGFGFPGFPGGPNRPGHTNNTGQL
ncbi:MAG: hypothetical protein F6K11_07505 [Leptolyngbya sp. SIO3F4]|nr:hypothetical protein [Leptolyngbya sp. SIO3F4]